MLFKVHHQEGDERLAIIRLALHYSSSNYSVRWFIYVFIVIGQLNRSYLQTVHRYSLFAKDKLINPAKSSIAVDGCVTRYVLSNFGEYGEDHVVELERQPADDKHDHHYHEHLQYLRIESTLRQYMTTTITGIFST